MSDDKNGLERLRATNPVDENHVEGPDSRRARQLLTQLLDTPRVGRNRRHWSPRRLRLSVALAVLALVTIAAAVIWTRAIEAPEAIICYQEASVTSDRAAAPAGAEANAQACESVWEDGLLVNPLAAPEDSIPPLTACVAKTGALAVFPTSDAMVCDALGLAYPDPASQRRADSVRQLQDLLIGDFLEQECMTLSEAEAIVHRRLDALDLGSWHIRSQPETTDRPCASFSIDALSETIHLVPIPRPDG